MSDDPCECLLGHEAMIRRLISLLRQSTDDCTDGECVDGENPMGPANTIMMLALMGIFAAFMYATRPNSLRAAPNNTNGKPDGNGQQQPPPPPPPPSIG